MRGIALLPFTAVSQLSPEVERRRRLVTRTLPLALIAVVAFVVGAAAGAPGSPEKDAAEPLRRGLGGGRLRRHVPGAEPRLAGGDRASTTSPSPTAKPQQVATLRSLDPGSAAGPRLARRRDRGRRCRSRSPPSPSAASKTSSSCPTPTAASPGTRASSSRACATASTSTAEIELAPRAPILAGDGTPLAEGPAEEREHPLGSAAIDVTGEVGSAGEEDLPRLARQGFAAGHPGRDQRPRAGLQRPPRRQAGRLAARGRRRRHRRSACSPRPSRSRARR